MGAKKGVRWRTCSPGVDVGEEEAPGEVDGVVGGSREGDGGGLAAEEVEREEV
jgi:hypothetical protein